MLRLHALAVGRAAATVLELPSGRLAVVDFGHPALLDYLAALDPGATRRFAFCLLTHAHKDHYAGLGEFIARHDARVDEYWFSCAKTGDILDLAALHQAAQRGGRGRLLVQDEARPAWLPLEPGVEVARFAPSTAEVLRSPAAGDTTLENNRSVVLLIRHGAATILLGADAEGARWRRIAAQAAAGGIDLAADVVLAPHHGAAAPRGLPVDLWPEVSRGRQSAVVFSAGRHERWPALATIRAASAVAMVRCTGRSQTCSPLGPPAESLLADPADLVALALPPAPEAQNAPACFGTQIYACDPAGRVTLERATNPAPPLEACLPARAG